MVKKKKDLLEWNRIRSQILLRDSYTCRKCGKKKTKHNQVKLVVHHKKLRSEGGLDNPENLITLCKRCERRIHILSKDRGKLRKIGGESYIDLKPEIEEGTVPFPTKEQTSEFMRRLDLFDQKKTVKGKKSYIKKIKKFMRENPAVEWNDQLVARFKLQLQNYSVLHREELKKELSNIIDWITPGIPRKRKARQIFSSINKRIRNLFGLT